MNTTLKTPDFPYKNHCKIAITYVQRNKKFIIN